MILSFSCIFGPGTSTFLKLVISLNSAQFPGRIMVLSTKEAPKLAGSGGLERKN